MMKRILKIVLWIAALFFWASPAMAYEVRVTIDGPAIAANCTEMYVELVLEENDHFGAKFWPQFDGDGKMTGVIANYWGVNYPLTADTSTANFRVKELSKPLQKIKARTCHGKNLEKSFGGSKSDQVIGIRKNEIDPI